MKQIHVDVFLVLTVIIISIITIIIIIIKQKLKMQSICKRDSIHILFTGRPRVFG